MSGDLNEVVTVLSNTGDIVDGGLMSDSKGSLYLYIPTFTSGVTENTYLYTYNSTTGTLDALQDFTSGVASWFACGNATLKTVPLTDPQSLAACSLNGVKWQVFVPDYKFFNAAELESWAINSYATGKCTGDIYDAVCEVVAELPPYICTKEVRAGISTYIGVAAANADFLYGALVFVCGILLDMGTAYLAKSRNRNTRNSKCDETEVVSERWVELAVSDDNQVNLSGGAFGVSQQSMDTAIAAALESFSYIYDRKISALQKELDANNEKIIVKQEQVSFIHDRQISALQKELDSNNEKIVKQEQQISGLESEVDRLQGEIADHGTNL